MLQIMLALKLVLRPSRLVGVVIARASWTRPCVFFLQSIYYYPILLYSIYYIIFHYNTTVATKLLAGLVTFVSISCCNEFTL